MGDGPITHLFHLPLGKIVEFRGGERTRVEILTVALEVIHKFPLWTIEVRKVLYLSHPCLELLLLRVEIALPYDSHAPVF